MIFDYSNPEDITPMFFRAVMEMVYLTYGIARWSDDPAVIG